MQSNIDDKSITDDLRVPLVVARNQFLFQPRLIPCPFISLSTHIAKKLS